MLCHVNAEGRFDEGVLDALGDKGQVLIGQEVLKGGGKIIVQLLEEAKVLLKMEKIKHKYPYDWKTKEPIIVR
jgi:isoleucyl-tRNA synthetase